MELMAGTDEDQGFQEEVDGVEPNMKSVKWVSSSRFVSGRYINKGRAQARAQVNDKVGFASFRRNQSIGDGSELFSTKADKNTRLTISSRATNDM